MIWSNLPGAARGGMAAGMFLLGLRAGVARAESGPNLILPLVTAIAVASAAADAPAYIAGARAGGGRPLLSLIPRRFEIQDGYEYDVDDYIGRRSFAPVNGDRIVSFDLLRRPKRGWMASLAYDEESRGPLKSGDEVLTLEVEYPF
jgi:hypothetical protein